MKPGSSNIENFMENYDIYNLMKEPTCYKSNPPKCYDFILTNKKYSYINTGTYETGLSDHHKLTYTVLKTEVVNLNPLLFHTDAIKLFLPINLTRIFNLI